ncbi:reverse transcriptase/maturase family protein [Streptomyces sp. H27-H1]|uniref:reverse transcriptase/maturase family protein n=1 Tax=Streptomyces sp. H27-H1 TaxID=2996461 RepID=UPI003B637776
MIPKANGKLRRLGIPNVADRVVQASLKLMPEPVLEADLLPYSYGFRPNRRAHAAIAETRYLASHSCEWVMEGDITACFDEISHTALMGRVRIGSGTSGCCPLEIDIVADGRAALMLRLRRQERLPQDE